MKGKKIAILGIAFKPNTDDVRDAPSLTIIPILQEQGAIIHAHDPEAKEQAERHLNNVMWHDDPYAAAQDADALVILTEWNEYRALAIRRLGEILKDRKIIDLRNIYKTEDMRERGFHYVSVGREEILPGEAPVIKKAV